MTNPAINTERWQRYSSDPAAFRSAVLRYRDSMTDFIGDLVIVIRGQRYHFRDVVTEFQLRWLADVAPAVSAVMRGKVPEVGQIWTEWVKGLGKDTITAMVILWLLIFSKRAPVIQIAAVDSAQAKLLKKAAEEIARENPWIHDFVEFQTSKIANPHTGGEAEILTADNPGSHGARPDMLVLNELSHVEQSGPNAWEYVLTLLDNASKIPGCLTLALMNAGFEGSEAWKMRERVRVSPRWRFHQHCQPADWIDPAVIAEAAERNSPSRQARLYAGVWSRGTGDRLPADAVERCVNKDLSPMTGDEPGYKFVFGVDAGVIRDKTGVTGLATVPGSKVVRLAYCRSWHPSKGKPVDLVDVRDTLKDLWEQFHKPEIFYDPSQMRYMAGDLTAEFGQSPESENKSAKEMTFKSANLELMAVTLMQAVRQSALQLYPFPELVIDILKLVIIERAGTIRLDAPRDATGHADLATSLCIALPRAIEIANRKPRRFAVGVGDDTSSSDGIELPPGVPFSTFVRSRIRQF